MPGFVDKPGFVQRFQHGIDRTCTYRCACSLHCRFNVFKTEFLLGILEAGNNGWQLGEVADF